MPRCRIRWPSPQSTSRYLPRRCTAFTVRPARRRTSALIGQRSRASRTATPLITRPASCGARPRRVTSTSGSSGMGKCACAGHQIYLRWVASIMGETLLAAAAFSLACGLAWAQGKSIDKSVGDLNEPTLYDFLLGEIALQRGDLPLAAKTYLELAKRTRDPRIARRAVEVANQARMPELALEAARTWHEIEPTSAHALQVLAAMLVAAKRVDEAEPVLDK